MKNFTFGNLTIQAELHGNHVKFLWLGASDNKDLQKTLDPYCLETLNSLKGKEVAIDFTKLEIMNSSSVPAIISWIKLLAENEIVTQIVYNKDSNWQKSSFRLLGSMTLKYKTIKVDGV